MQTVQKIGTLFILAGVALAGCGSHPHRSAMGVEIDWRPGATALGADLTLPPDLARLTIGKLTVEEAPRAPGDLALPVDARVLRLALRDVLRASAAFEDVALAEDAPPGDSALVLETRVERARLRRTEASGLFARLIFWGFLGFLADWRHDETYALELEPTFALTDPAARQRVFQKRAAQGKAEEELNLFERASGALPVLATVVWWPQPAVDSDPAEVTRALAHASLRAPVRDLLTSLAGLTPQCRVQATAVPAGLRSPVRAELLLPKPGTVLAFPASDVEVSVRLDGLGAGELRKIVIGEREREARGETARVRVPGVELVPGKTVDVRVVLAKEGKVGAPIPVISISVKRELAPKPARAAAAGSPAPTATRGGKERKEEALKP